MIFYPKKYDIIVVGGGHAGCEAALSAARMGCSVLLTAIDLDKVAAMPCSPSIGGMAKGQLVKEIDALGGQMGKIADETAVQYRTLNTKKGPAVHSTRSRVDKAKYHSAMKLVLERQPNLEMKQALVEKLIIEDGKIAGVEDQTGYAYQAECVVLASGTFFSGLVHIGLSSFQAGRAGEFASYGLPGHLRELGFNLGRMKTGTPPRLNKNTVDYSKFIAHETEEVARPFSFINDKINSPQLPSYIGHTNEKSRQVIMDNLDRSPLYNGSIKGVSARYCPSFEDKTVRFPDKFSHQVILESEGLGTDEIYASGLGNSLPMDVQLQFVRSVEGLEEAEIMRPAYAIEYDYIEPTQLHPTFETKRIPGLFTAGQLNGTSGYEEAGSQGLWAGINAACKVQKREPFILDRSEAYIGVLVDDLVTRGTKEPYRMFTSRAEYRLLLREDNADLRLAEKGHELGLISTDHLNEILDRKKQIDGEISRIKKTIVRPSVEINDYLERKGTNPIDNGVYLDQLVKRAGLDYSLVNVVSESSEKLSDRVIRQVEIELKYEGYIKRQLTEIEKFKNLEKIKIPADFSYNDAHGLSSELKAKLAEVKPFSLGQASRIDGMTPAAISVLMVGLKTHGKKGQVQ